jgi:hypothetical protein
MTIQLSNISPDFDSIRLQLEQAAQSGNFPSWKDRITGATGQTILEMVAAIGAYSQYSIESSYQESWPDSAKNPEALYAAANYAGVRINRRQPASITLMMQSPTNMVVPPITAFVGAGTYWYNRAALNLTNSLTPVTLYQGQIVQKQVNGSGTDFQAFLSEESSFQVADGDVYLKVNNVSVPVIPEGLWTCNGTPGVQQFTLPDGKLILLFGNSLYGTKPGTNDLCTITYVTTLGVDGNNIVTTGKKIVMDGNADVLGTPTGNPSGGSAQTDYIVYKNITPALFGAFDSAVTANQYKKYPLLYPGVIDARVLAQREINPKALTFMNTMKVCLLTSTVFSTADFDAFETWFNKGVMYSTRIIREDPVPVDIAVIGRISCKNFANLSAVQTKVGVALDKLFALRQGSIGLDLYISDIIDAIKQADSNVEYIQLSSPPVDLVLSSLSVGYPTLRFVPGGGTLPAGTYDYGIGLLSSLGGTAAPGKWRTIQTPSVGGIVVTWPLAANPASYQVYGRVTGGAMGLLANIAATGAAFQSFNDDGSVVPTGTVPAQSTIASYYPHLISKALTMQYTNRNLRA